MAHLDFFVFVLGNGVLDGRETEERAVGAKRHQSHAR